MLKKKTKINLSHTLSLKISKSPSWKALCESDLIEFVSQFSSTKSVENIDF